MITTGSWKTASMIIEPALEINGKLTTDFNSQFDACDKDDLTKFNLDGSINDEGPTKCDPTDDQTWPFVWNFDVAEKILVWDGEEYTIVQLDENKFTISEKLLGDDLDNGQSGVTYTLTINMVH